MNTKLVSSIDAVARSRLVTNGADATLVDAAKLLSDTQISLVVVCDPDGAMAGVISKTDIVRQIGHCGGREEFKPIGVVNARDALRELLVQEKYEESLLRDYVMGVGYR